MIKKIVVAAGILSLLAGTLMTINYVCGRKVISRYGSGIYENSEVNMVLGFTQPYIYHYNQGNIYYSKGDYAGAAEEYSHALEYSPSGDRDCYTRINLALSMVRPIDVESVTADNLDETLDILENAKNILLENGCAHDEDENGHNSDAQTIKDEIDEFEKKLQEKVNQDDKNQDDEDQDDQGDQNDDSNDSKDDTTEDQTSGREEDIRQQLEQIQGDSLNQRNQEMDSYETYKEDFQYYDGQTW